MEETEGTEFTNGETEKTKTKRRRVGSAAGRWTDKGRVATAHSAVLMTNVTVGANR